MSTRQRIEQFTTASKEGQPTLASDALSLSNAHACENRNSVEQDLGLQARFAEGKSIEDWKIERLENFVCSTQVVTSMNSYKAQKTENSWANAMASTSGEALWQAVQQLLQSELSLAVYETWIAPCRLESIDHQMVTLATSTDFSVSIIDRRYGSAIRQAFNQVLGQPIRLRYQVVPELEPPKPRQTSAVTSGAITFSAPNTAQVVQPEYPLARLQNPTNNQQVALLLERYGDIRGVMKNHPFFQRIQLPVDEGGWGTDLAGLIYFAKEYTLERVLWAAKQAKEYQGSRSRGAVFTHAVRKGLEAK
mgnify:CR=1 FL=1